MPGRRTTRSSQHENVALRALSLRPRPISIGMAQVEADALATLPFHLVAAGQGPDSGLTHRLAALVAGCTVLVINLRDEANGNGKRSVARAHHEDVIRAAVFAPEGNWLATAGDDKAIKVWSLRGESNDDDVVLQCVWQRTTQKKPSQLLWLPSHSQSPQDSPAKPVPDEDCLGRLVFADKFGSVYPVTARDEDNDNDNDNGNDNGADGDGDTDTATGANTDNGTKNLPFKIPQQLVLGHYSTIVKLLHVRHRGSGREFIVSCDRDDKIRVSHYPNCYNIQSFCLGHEAFISACTWVDEATTLVSGGGDGKLILWDILTGSPLQTIELASHVDASLMTAHSQSQPHSPTPVVTNVVWLAGVHQLFVSLEGYRGALVFSLASDHHLRPGATATYLTTVPFPHPIRSLAAAAGGGGGDVGGELWLTTDGAPWVHVHRPEQSTSASQQQHGLLDSVHLPHVVQRVPPHECTRILGLVAVWSNLRKFIGEGASQDAFHRQSKRPRVVDDDATTK